MSPKQRKTISRREFVKRSATIGAAAALAPELFRNSLEMFSSDAHARMASLEYDKVVDYHKNLKTEVQDGKVFS